MSALNNSVQTKPIIGFHSGVFNLENLRVFTDAIVKHLAPRGINMAVMEMNLGYKFQCHPELSEGDIDAASLRAACDEMRACGVEPVILFNCFGHQGWSWRNRLLKVYPELDEASWLKDPDDFNGKWEWAHRPPEDEKGRWQWAYTPTCCCNEPKVYDVIFPLMDELLEASGCKTIHVGLDELVLMNQCDRCRNIPRHVLFKNVVTTLHDHFAAKGVRMMMWADRLINAFAFDPYMFPSVGMEIPSDYDNLGTALCVDDIPKDILMVNWHYGHSDYHFAGELLRHGHTVIPGVWSNPENAAYLWENSTQEAQLQNCPERLPGILICNWNSVMDACKPFETPDAPMGNEIRYLKDVVEKVTSIVKQ